MSVACFLINNAFWRTEGLNFDILQFNIFFSFLVRTFGVLLRNLCLISTLLRFFFFPYFLSESLFLVLESMIIIHFKIIFVSHMRYASYSGFFFPHRCPASYIAFIEKIVLSSLSYIIAFIKYLITVVGIFSDSIVSHLPIFLPLLQNYAVLITL